MATEFSQEEIMRAKELYGLDVTRPPLRLAQRMFVESEIADSGRVFHSSQELHDFTREAIQKYNDSHKK